jgi:nucleoside phosphorylase
MLDAIAALEPRTPVTFVGYAGTLRTHRPGSILEVSAAMVARNSAVYYRTFGAALISTSTIAVTVGTLVESMELRDQLRQSAECVDMETGHVYAACNAQEHPVRSLLIISDDFESHPFYRSGVTEAISKGVEVVCGFISSYISEVIG